jgi:hypothetical protein
MKCRRPFSSIFYDLPKEKRAIMECLIPSSTIFPNPTAGGCPTEHSLDEAAALSAHHRREVRPGGFISIFEDVE